MRRRLFNLLAALSLLAGIAVAGGWVRSYWVSERLGWRGDEWAVGLAWFDGHIGWIVDTGRPNERSSVDYYRIGPFGADDWWEEYGFWMYRVEDLTKSYRYWVFLMPGWVALLLTMIAPGWWLVQHRRQRERQGLCRQCGYDLQGLPGPRPRCPECGTEASEHAEGPMIKSQ